MPSGNLSDEGLSYEKRGTSMGESARAVAIFVARIDEVVSMSCGSP
jgi:hypothetical protein